LKLASGRSVTDVRDVETGAILDAGPDEMRVLPMSTTAPHPAPVPPANPAKKRRKWPWIIGGLVVLIVIVATTTSHGGTITNPTTSTTISPAAPPATHAPAHPAPAAATTAAPATTAPATPVILYSKTGSGTGSTPTFTTAAEWQVQYSYDCTAFGQSGNFMVTSEDFQLAINQLGTKGADTDYVHNDPGSHSLSIDSECAWTVKVLG
jgi:hypothetical protein